jgi:hypothetical protein
VPNFVKCLGDVEESSGTVMFIVIYFVHNATCLMGGTSAVDGSQTDGWVSSLGVQ